MKTSYFAKYSRLPQEEKDKYTPIAISTTIPKWFKECEFHLYELSPSSESVFKLKHGQMEVSEFTLEYTDKLRHWVRLDSILEDIAYLESTREKEVVLLCYEKSDDFCHRHLLRDYLNNNGLNVEEL